MTCAVLENGRIVPKTRKDQEEIALLSRCCDHVNEKPVPPREPRELVHRCVNLDDPEAWEAAREDLVTGDLAPNDIAEGCTNNNNPIHILIRTTSTDAYLVLGAASDVLDAEIDPAAIPDILQNAMALTDKDASLRPLVLAAAAKFIARCPAHPTTADRVLEGIRRHGPEGVRAFLRLPLGDLVSVRPQLLLALVECANKAPLLHRYPPLAALANIVRRSPGTFRGFEFGPVVKGTFVGMLEGRGKVDVRIAAAAAMLAETSEDHYIRVLGGVISCLATTLLQERTPPEQSTAPNPSRDRPGP